MEHPCSYPVTSQSYTAGPLCQAHLITQTHRLIGPDWLSQGLGYANEPGLAPLFSFLGWESDRVFWEAWMVLLGGRTSWGEGEMPLIPACSASPLSTPPRTT